MKKILDLWQKKEYEGMKPGLSRLRNFLKEIGNPHAVLKFVHIAGTNGKGSVSKIIASVLSGSGYKTGLYTSPHLVSLNERISVDNKKIGEAYLNRLAEKYYRAAKKHNLTFFEFITALAFIYFNEKGVAVAVLETGLGGRFDGTNVIRNPLVSVITDIDYDHTAVLGKTLSKIAREKAGIIKKNCPLVSGALKAEARKTIEKQAKLKNAAVFRFGKEFMAKTKNVDWRKKLQSFEYISSDRKLDLDIALLGEHQIKNAAVALKTLEILDSKGYKFNLLKTSAILRNIVWPGRFDIRTIRLGGKERTLILDGSHNPSGIQALCAALAKSPWGKKKNPFIFAVMKDKDYGKMLRGLSARASKIAFIPIGAARAFAPEKLKNMAERICGNTEIIVCGSLGEVFKKYSDEKVIISAGSLYLIGKILKYIKSAEN